MWTVTYAKAARKAMQRLDRKTRDRIFDKFQELAKDPYAPNNNVKQLHGAPAYRLRIGDWRAIYTLQDDMLIVTVVRVAARGRAYE